MTTICITEKRFSSSIYKSWYIKSSLVLKRTGTTLFFHKLVGFGELESWAGWGPHLLPACVNSHYHCTVSHKAQSHHIQNQRLEQPQKIWRVLVWTGYCLVMYLLPGGSRRCIASCKMHEPGNAAGTRSVVWPTSSTNWRSEHTRRRFCKKTNRHNHMFLGTLHLVLFIEFCKFLMHRLD